MKLPIIFVVIEGALGVSGNNVRASQSTVSKDELSRTTIEKVEASKNENVSEHYKARFSNGEWLEAFQYTQGDMKGIACCVLHVGEKKQLINKEYFQLIKNQWKKQELMKYKRL